MTLKGSGYIPAILSRAQRRTSRKGKHSGRCDRTHPKFNPSRPRTEIVLGSRGLGRRRRGCSGRRFHP